MIRALFRCVLIALVTTAAAVAFAPLGSAQSEQQKLIADADASFSNFVRDYYGKPVHSPDILIRMSVHAEGATRLLASITKAADGK